jgi:hypothetical protein
MLAISAMIKVPRQPHRLPLLCALLLCLLISPGGAWGYIWCIGVDGHSHAKATTGSGADDCHPHQDPPSREGDRALTDGSGGLDRCLHIAITSQFGRDASRTHQPLGDNLPMTSPATLAASSLLPQQQLTNGLIPQTPPRIAETLLLHRTTVLLI